MTGPEFHVGSTVRFFLENEKITGTHLPTLSIGTVSDRSIVACALRQIVPIEVRTITGESRIVWVSDDQILTASTHPSGGLP